MICCCLVVALTASWVKAFGPSKSQLQIFFQTANPCDVGLGWTQGKDVESFKTDVTKRFPCCVQPIDVGILKAVLSRHAFQTVSLRKKKKMMFHTVDGRNPEPRGMHKTL